MNWLGAEWHKIVGAMTGIVILIVHGEELIEKLSKILGIKTWIQRQIGDRRKDQMHIISELLQYIEGLFKTHAPEIVAAATSPQAQAIEQAAVAAAVQAGVQTAAQDPKIQAGIAVYQAVKNYNAVANAQAIVPPPLPQASPLAS
jgi:hypothetical protein